jgi:uncharacterized protein (TIGR03435 family)
MAVCAAAALTAQSPVAAQAPSGPRFGVASLKERDRNVPLGVVGLQQLPGRLVNRCATLTSLVYYAFKRTGSTPIEGLPEWASTPCSDADVKDTYEFEARMPPETTDADSRLMLQAVLAERFKLAFHWETRTRPVFALVVARDGLKVKPAEPKDDPPRPRGFFRCPIEDRDCSVYPMGILSMSQIADLLGGDEAVGRPVIDRTGVMGTYYFDTMRIAGDTPFSPLPSLRTALREQSGLELRPDTAPVEVLVIDRAEKPVPN